MKTRLSITIVLLAGLLLAAGCASFSAEPSTFTFEGIRWKVSSAELVNELAFPPIEPRSASEVLLIVQFDPVDGPIDSSQGNTDLRAAFGEIILKGTGRTPDQFYPVREEQAGPIMNIVVVFSVPGETTYAELVLSDSQIVKITLKR